jgi:hypothetical protein
MHCRLTLANLKAWALQGVGVEDIAVLTGRPRLHVIAVAKRKGLWPSAWLPVTQDQAGASQ